MLILSYKGHGPYSHFYDGMFMEAITDKKGKDGTADDDQWTVRV